MSKRPEGLVEALPSLRRVLARLVPYMRGQRMLLAGSVTALLAATGTKLLEPWPLKFIFDRVVPSVVGQEPAAAALAPLTLLALCAGGLIAIIGLKALFEYLSKVGFALAGNRIVTAVRNDLFRHLQTLSLRFHTRARTGDLAMRLVRDVGMLKETAVTAALPLIANAFILVGMVVVMLVLDWQLALLALSPLPLLWLLSVRLTRRIHSVSRTQRRREGEMASTGAETMAGIRTIQALGLEEQASEEFNAISGQDLRMSVQGTRLAALLERSVDLLTGLGLAIVLWFGTRQVLDGRLSPGDLLVFVTYLKNTFRPVRQYAKYTARLAKAAAAGERVVSVLDEVPEVRDTREAVAAHGLAGAVTFDHVQFSYRADTSILKDLSLHVAPGKTIAITGASGAGKSTLISLLLRLYDPTKGSVQIDGHDLRTLTLASLRANIALVLQETLLFSGTLAENIALGAGREVTREEIEQAAKLANAHDFIAMQPNGYDTAIAERGATLSAGQRQRIAIARAALRHAPILVLDEPTVGLDRANEQAVIEAIWRLAKNRTTLLITHDLALAAQAGRIVHISGGRVAGDGNHMALLAQRGGYAAMWCSEGETKHAAAG